MRRIVISELLDTDSGTSAEITASLSDLRNINRRFGGIATTEKMIESVADQLGVRTLSLLEVAAGSGYVPLSVQRRLEKHGIQLEVTLLDRASSHLRNGDGNTANAARTVVADALALPFGDASFDLVGCCLFAHHLSPDQIVRFVNESLRVCRTAMLINDVVRHRLHLALIYAGMPLFHSRITRHDAVASVRRAYTSQEMIEILQRTNAARVEIHPHYLFRMGVIGWKSGRVSGEGD
jgi:ubiquinone/menaquinone biosynthesis C-methylase UbiE